MNELNDDQLFEELLNLKVEVVSGIDDEESMPIYDEYFSSKVFDSHSDEFDYIPNPLNIRFYFPFHLRQT